MGVSGRVHMLYHYSACVRMHLCMYSLHRVCKRVHVLCERALLLVCAHQCCACRTLGLNTLKAEQSASKLSTVLSLSLRLSCLYPCKEEREAVSM